MKKIVSETIDGSIKDIIQLKTLDASLEYSQMFDALEDTPREFQIKLVDALNSLGETMQIPPTEAFNKVLCKSDDENEGVTKKLYNWWRAFFEVLGKCEKIPKERVSEFNQKIDDLMAEIMKAGDAEATDEEEPVMESSDDEFGYQQATKDDEDKMLADMDFAVQHIGEVANKVKAVVNFVNPYCGTEVNESMDKPKFKEGDVVRVMNVSGMDFYGRDAPIGPIVKIEPPHPDVGMYEYLIKGRSGEFFAYEDELELLPERFTEGNKDLDNEVDNTMKNTVDERGGSDWVSMDDMIGMEVGESDEEPINWDDEDSYNDGGFERGMWVIWTDPDTDEESVWKILEMPKSEDDYFVIGQKDGSINEVPGWEIRPRDADVDETPDMYSDDEETFKDVYRESDGGQLNAQEFVDAMIDADEDMGDVFEVYDGGVEEEDTVYLNVLVHKESVSQKEVQAEFKDIAANWGWEFESFGYSSDMVDSIVDDDNCALVVYFKKVGEQQMNEEKVENELKKGDDGWTTIGQPVSEAKVVVDANDVWEVLDLLDDEEANKNLTALINSHVRTEEEIMDAIDTCYPDGIRKGELNAYMKDSFDEIVSELGLDVNKFKETGEFVDPEKPVALEGSDEEQKPDELKDGEKKYKQDGETKTLDFGENKSVVFEMTIEQEINDPWKLLNLLWGQGKENFEELLRSNLFSDDRVMDTLEQFEVKDLTNLNDLLAYDFEQVLDALGCDVEAWTQHLEIQRA